MGKTSPRLQQLSRLTPSAKSPPASICEAGLGSEQISSFTYQKSSQTIGNETIRRAKNSAGAGPSPSLQGRAGRQFLTGCNLFPSSLATSSEHCPRCQSEPVGNPNTCYRRSVPLKTISELYISNKKSWNQIKK